MAQILVIDDDVASLLLLFECLSALGHEVDCASEREAAEALLGCVRYDLVITDLSLTGNSSEDGLEILARVHELWPSTRVLLVSADLRPEAVKSAREIGVNGCFGKPLDLGRVQQRVDELLNGCGKAVY